MRCLLVWTSGTASLLGVSLLLRPETRSVTAGRPAEVLSSLAALPLDHALVDVAGCVLQVVVLWAWVAGSVTVAEAWRGVVATRRPSRRLPAGLRRVVLAGCGVAVATTLAAPALADTGHRSLLPLPARAVVPDGPAATSAPLREPVRRPPPPPRRAGEVHVEPGTPPPVPTRSVVVVAGDSLWSLAARELSPGATDADIAARWRAVYAANRSVVGPDPDLLLPGQRLTLPPRDVS